MLSPSLSTGALRIPIRGYELEYVGLGYELTDVTNPYKGL